jgi:hypothetical protein
MLVEIVLSGGVLVAVLGILDGARWRRSGAPAEISAEAAIREAMRGEEAGSVRAEFRRRGICPPERPRGPGFLWGSH